MARKVGQIIARGERTWLVRVCRVFCCLGDLLFYSPIVLGNARAYFSTAVGLGCDGAEWRNRLELRRLREIWARRTVRVVWTTGVKPFLPFVAHKYPRGDRRCGSLQMRTMTCLMGVAVFR